MQKSKLILFIIFILALCLPGYGQSYTSIATGSWSDPAVWTLPWGSAPVPPQGNQNVIISAGTTITGTTANTYTLDIRGTLIFNSSYSNSSGGLIIEDGGTLIINGNFTSSSNITILGTGVLKVTGNLTQSGGTININNSGILIVGQTFTEGSQTTNVYNNATILVVQDYIVSGGLHESGSGTEVVVLGTVIGSGNPAISNSIPTADPAWVLWAGSNPNLWKGNIDTNWSNTANWSGHAVPVSGANVDFDPAATNDLILDTDRKIGYFTNTSSKRLVIPANKCLTVNATITTNNDPNQIYIYSSSSVASGSLIFHNAQNAPVYATVEMYLLASWNLANPVGGKYKWQFFGIPVRSLASIYPTFSGVYIREMHENDSPSHWYQLNNGSSMSSFKGYEITQSGPYTYFFQGQLENSDYSVVQPFTSVASYPGESLIGNSYTAAIDIKKMVFGSQMLATVYLYNTGSQSDWLANGKNPADSTTALAGQYTAIPFALAGTGSLPGQIPSMQAFLVRAKSSSGSATLSIPYSAATTVLKNTTRQRVSSYQSTGDTVKTSADTLHVWTQIDVKGDYLSDRMWIFTDTVCTHSFDNGWDGEKFLGSYVAPQLFAREQDGDYQVNAVDNMNNTYLGFMAGQDSVYTLTFTHHNSTARYANIYLVDSVSRKTTDITASGSTYTFKSLPADTITKRFKIVTTVDISTPVIPTYVSANTLKVFSSQKTIFVDNTSGEAGTLEVYDIAGQSVGRYLFSGGQVNTIRTGLPSGVYVAKAGTKKDKLSVQLIIR
jgi:hypothetical protein